MSHTDRRGKTLVNSVIRAWLILLAGLFLCLPVSVLAEFYKYRDQNGTLRFTDNLAEVPPDQRPKVDRYKQVEDFQPSAVETSKPSRANRRQESEDEDRTERTRPDRGLSAAEAAERYKELNVKKAELDAEYQELLSIQQALQEERQNAKTHEQQHAVNQKVMALNQRIADFEQKRSAFQQEVQAFNEQR